MHPAALRVIPLSEHTVIMNTSLRSAAVRFFAVLLVVAFAGWGLQGALDAPAAPSGPSATQQALIVGGVAAAPFAMPVLTALWRSARE